MLSSGIVISPDYHLNQARQALAALELYVDHSITDLVFLTQLARNNTYAIPIAKLRNGELSSFNGLGITSEALHDYLRTNFPMSVPSSNRQQNHRYCLSLMNTITDGCFPAILLHARSECKKAEEAE